MRSVWKEYGVIAVLLIVAVGGYLLYSRNQDDVLRYSLDLIGGQLIALVPEGPDRERAAEAVGAFKQRVLEDDVAPGQVEAFAANVFNLGNSGEAISSEDAELLIRLSLQEGDTFPVPIAVASGSPQAAAPTRTTQETPAAAPPPGRALPSTPGSEGLAIAKSTPRVRQRPEPPSPEALVALGRRLERMTTFYVAMHDQAGGDSTLAANVHFSSQDGLHVVVDERVRDHRGMRRAEKTLEDGTRMVWQAQLGEELADSRAKRGASAERLERFRLAIADSLISDRAAIGALSALRRLESRGVIASSQVDSIARALEARIEAMIAPPPPPAVEFRQIRDVRAPLETGS